VKSLHLTLKKTQQNVEGDQEVKDAMKKEINAHLPTLLKIPESLQTSASGGSNKMMVALRKKMTS